MVQIKLSCKGGPNFMRWSFLTGGFTWAISQISIIKSLLYVSHFGICSIFKDIYWLRNTSIRQDDYTSVQLLARAGLGHMRFMNRIGLPKKRWGQQYNGKGFNLLTYVQIIYKLLLYLEFLAHSFVSSMNVITYKLFRTQNFTQCKHYFRLKNSNKMDEL